MNRRSFISQSAALGIGLPTFGNMLENQQMFAELMRTSANPVEDEDLWQLIRGMFEPDKSFVNLENGYFSPQPVSTRNYFDSRTAYINRNTSRYMRTQHEDAHEKTRSSLAHLAGAHVEETALVRNTTEAMNIIIMGYPWKKGDEVIYSNQDYGSMVEQLQQASERFGIVLKKIELPLHPANDEDIVNKYIEAISPATRLMLVTHLINLSGQILPLSKIIAEAHKKNVEVLVDAAHSFAQIPCNFAQLNADYLGCSLHKWLSNPLGAGMLCVKKEHISKIWPLFGDHSQAKKDIKKFEHYGTHPPAVFESIIKAILFHELIGAELKEKRLRFLQNSWTTVLPNTEKIILNTPIKDQRSCALANVGIQGISPAVLSKRLMADYNIFTVAIEHPAINGIRVTPHLYTSKSEITLFSKAIQSIVEEN